MKNKHRKTPHTEMVNKIRSILNRAKIYHYKHWGGPYGKKGVADIIGIRKVRVDDLVKKGVKEIGVFVAIEIKVGRDKLSDDQKDFLKAISRSGGIAMVADSENAVMKRLGLFKTIYPLFAQNDQREK